MAVKKRKHIIFPAGTGSGFASLPIITNNSGWQQYISLPLRTQNENTWDEDNCATRAAIECIEAVFNYYLKNNLLSAPLAVFLKSQFCNDQGYVKLSIRYNAKLNNTTPQGVKVDTVFNNFAIYGVVPESIYPDPPAPFTWAQYYSDVPESALLYGKAMVNTFKIAWKVIQSDVWTAPNLNLLRDNLAYSPLYFAGMTCALDANGIEQWCNSDTYQHCRVLINFDQYLEVLDSEPPKLLRQLALNFPLPCLVVVGIQFNGLVNNS